MSTPTYLSVSQFADLHGMDKGRIRRLIIDGRLPAIKIGAQWAIAADTQPPTDARVKSGKYRNWRNKEEGD